MTQKHGKWSGGADKFWGFPSNHSHKTAQAMNTLAYLRLRTAKNKAAERRNTFRNANPPPQVS